jgi:tRNA (guanine37-N1)-methyltransferase
LRYIGHMQIDIFTLFPAMFDGPLTESILKRAQDNGLLTIRLHNIRDFATDKHRVTDEPPYGGGGGMIMKVEPIVSAVETALGDSLGSVPVILTTPQGRVFNQGIARELAAYPRLAFICGRYEGVDERVRELVVTDEISIGDYVLTGGELPAMVMIDAIVRNIPGVLGARWAAEDDSHATGLLEHAHYTRPPTYRDLDVPASLLSGDHAGIEQWRRQDAIRRTWQRRPDLLLEAALTDSEKYSLASLADGWLKHRREHDGA